MRKKVIIIFVLSLTKTALFGQAKQPVIDSFFQALVKYQQFSGNVLVVDKDKIVYEKSFGFADHLAKTPNTRDITFPIASITKIFTATAILQLKEKGLIDIAAPVNKYLTAFPYPEVTVRHLLSHTSGLPPYNAFFDEEKKAHPDKVFQNQDFLPRVVANKKPLIYQPGEKGNYDNINYLVLALIIEKVSGTTYGNYIESHILKPAGMKETRLFPLPEQFNSGEIKNYAYPHVYLHLYDTAAIRSNSIPYVKAYWRAYGFRGFADYTSTVRDLWKFDRALYNHTLLKQQTLDEAFIPVKLNNGQYNADRFGLGWEVEKDSTIGKLVYHSGAAMGLSCNIMRNVSRHQTVIIFDNRHFNAHENATKVMLLLNGQHVDKPKRSIARLYGNILMTKGAASARKTLEALKKDTANYYLSEDEMNSLGYDFTGNSNPYHLPEQHFYKQALETFKTNVALFPDSWNAYDSYAEALLAEGQKEEAIKMYQRSLEINPKSESGQKALQKILGKDK